MSFGVYDFSESLNRVEIKEDDVKRVTAAWGTEGDYAEWEGGFLMEMKDGRWCYVEGWCDTTGWGCQDGAEVKWFTAEPELVGLTEKNAEWESDPPDCARYLAGEIDKFA